MTIKAVVGVLWVFLSVAGVSSWSGVKPDDAPELKTVPQVDLSRYMGKWYEIARFPNSFQEGCLDSTAEYAISDGGKVSVLNSCREANDGKRREAKGVAEVEDSRSNAKLKVSFVPGFLRWLGIGRGDYWIIDLAPDYSYSVVSEPSRKYLWILSREPSVPKATLSEILRRLEANHYDTEKLVYSQVERDLLRPSSLDRKRTVTPPAE